MASALAVVTGAAQGIGLEVTRKLVSLGYAVAMIDMVDAVRSASDEIRRLGGDTHAFTLDVRDGDAMRTLAARIEASLGPVYGLVTCAGTTRSAPLATMSLEDWSLVIDINLTGTFLSCQAFSKAMLVRGRGAIVTVASVSGTGGQSGRANYVSSKWGVIGLTKSLAIEWGNQGVRVNAVAPGPINTSLYAKVPEEFRERVIRARTPLKRVAEPIEVANTIAFLLSDGASYVNGTVLTVDGGLSAGFVTHMSGADLAT